MNAKADSVALYKIRKTMSELSTKKGRGTELVSLYVPSKKPIHEVMSALRDEHGTASNIKSDLTRTHVQDALTRTMQRLKLYHRTPQNGLVIFCGALSTNGPGSEVVFLYEILPPKPVQTYLYRCDDHFHLEGLQEMLREEKVIGIMSIDTSETGLGIVTGSKFDVVDVMTSGVSGKHRAGGQSARRFERLRDMELTDYYHRVARHASKAFLEDYKAQALIVSGPGPTKDDFIKKEFLDYRLQKNIIAVIDTSYAGREGVRESLAKSDSILQDIRLMEEKKLVQRFLKEVNAVNGLAIYGVGDILENLKKANIEVILIADDIDLTYIQVVCRKCGIKKEKFIRKSEYVLEKQTMITEACNGCLNIDYEILEKDVIEYLADLSIDSNTKIEVVSSKTEDGSMLKSFGGIGALLRYR
jgi:peptide chain release factor subunit 1